MVLLWWSWSCVVTVGSPKATPVTHPSPTGGGTRRGFALGLGETESRRGSPGRWPDAVACTAALVCRHPPPAPSWDSPNQEADLKTGFFKHLQALPLRGRGGLVEHTHNPPLPFSPSTAPKERPPGSNIIWGHSGSGIPGFWDGPWKCNCCLGNSLAPLSTAWGQSQPPPPAALPGDKDPSVTPGAAHTQSRHRGTPYPREPPPNGGRARSPAKSGVLPPKSPPCTAAARGRWRVPML